MTPDPGPGLFSRRRLLGGAAAIGTGLAAGGLSGCGSSVSISSDPNELVLWYWNRSVSPELLAQAAQSIPGSPGVRLRGDVIGGTFDTKLRTSLAGGAYIPDVTCINSNCALYFPNESQFVDLNTLGAQEAKGDYYPWKWQLGTTPSDRLIFWPMDTGPTGFYFRSDLFDQAGLPSTPDAMTAAITTWDDFIEVGKKLRANDGPAIVNQAVVIYNQFINASAERYFDSQNRPLFSNEGSAVRRAWETATAAIAAGITGNRQTSNDQNSAWVSGSTAGHIEAVWWAQILGDTAPDTKGKWRLATQPVGPGNSGGSFLAVPATSKNPKAAFDFIRWLTDPVNQAVSFNTIQLFPSTPASFESGSMKSETGFFGDQDALQFFRGAAEKVPTTFISTYESQVEAFSTELANVETGAKSAEQGWDDAVDQVNRVLKKRGVI